MDWCEFFIYSWISFCTYLRWRIGVALTKNESLEEVEKDLDAGGFAVQNIKIRLYYLHPFALTGVIVLLSILILIATRSDTVSLTVSMTGLIAVFLGLLYFRYISGIRDWNAFKYLLKVLDIPGGQNSIYVKAKWQISKRKKRIFNVNSYN